MENLKNSKIKILYIIGLIIGIFILILGIFLFKNGNLGKADINYKFSIKSSIKTPYYSGGWHLTNGKIYLDKNNYRERFYIGNFVEEENGRKQDVINNFDIITDNFKTYIKYNKNEIASKSLFRLFNIIGDLVKNNNNFKYKNVDDLLDGENYVLVDNRKIIKNMLGILSNVDFIREFVLYNISPNSELYWTKHNIGEKLGKLIKDGNTLNYVFETKGSIEKDGETWEELKVSDKICTILDNFSMSFSKSIGMEVTPNEKNCKNNILSLNKEILNDGKILKYGNLKKGDFNFELDYLENSIKIEYKNNQINKRNYYYSNNQNYATIEGNGEKIEKTDIYYSFKNENINIEIKIKDGNGYYKFDINNPQGAFILYEMYFKNYKIDQEKKNIIRIGEMGENFYDIVIENDNYIISLENIYKISGIKSNINILNILVNFKTNIYEIFINDTSGTFNVKYDNGKIIGKIDNSFMSADINGNFNNIREFDINIYEKGNKENNFIKISAKTIENKTNYNLIFKNKGETLYELFGTLEFLENAMKIKFWTEENIENEVKEIINSFDFILNLEKNTEKFEIPRNIKELESNLLLNRVTNPFGINTLNLIHGIFKK